MRLSKVIALLAIVATFASCGVMRKNKNKQSSSLEMVNKRDSITIEKATAVGQIKEQEIDKGTIITQREVTTVMEKGGKSKLTIKKGELKPGDNFLKDSAGLQVKAILDTVGQTLTLEINTTNERTIKTERETITEKKDQTKKRQENQEQKQEKQVAVTTDQRRSEKSSNAVSESQPSGTGILWNWIGGAVAVLLVVVGFSWWFLRRGKEVGSSK